jgi:hypothetical protein
MKRVFLLAITTALAVSSASALEGSREIPARVLPVPDTVSPGMQAAIGAPPLPFWNTHPKSADEWKAFVQQLADVTLKRLPALRELTGVTVEPTTIGGVKAFVITPREVADGSLSRSQSPPSAFDRKMLLKSRDYLIEFMGVSGGPQQRRNQLRESLLAL